MALVRLKRVYEPPEAADGMRVLVERLWPRGCSHESLKLDAWLRELAPSTELRRWFCHDPQRWEEFRRRYRAELDAHPEAWKPLLEAVRRGPVTLLFSARDTERNSAVVLREYILERLQAESGTGQQVPES